MARASISLPKSAPPGKVLARHYFTPIELCGKSTCRAKTIIVYPDGGAEGTGPVISTNVSGIAARMLINGAPMSTQRNITPRLNVSQPVEIQLLSDGKINAGGNLNGTVPGKVPFYFYAAFDENVDGDFGKIFLSATITPIDRTCSMPARTVRLASIGLNQFTGAGSTVARETFHVQLLNCPKGYNSISYTLEPVGGVVQGIDGALPLGADATAGGIRIRVADEKGAP